ncbi:uncharacterized protein LOC109712089 [Ananas comosus]|uniref:Uncharacterized protein LOC109712089 n=2 Tax=Ananas comosus TaxID=4615 RepID=A0A6P5FCJ5_ANACO|nr:uncharacterized protein LOC109712089 [Ananas comosus]CAD1827833.1 unnamed protein product [Ananas comosus var. bracteatus]
MDKVKVMLLCVAIFVTAILLSGHVAAAEVHGDHRKAAHDDLICNGDLNKLRRFCRRSIANDGRRAMAPTWTCCDTVLIVDMYCLCREITPRLERAVSMERVAHVAEVCRRPIRSGTRCGSYTVPTFQMAKKKLQPPPPPKIQEERRVVPPPPPPRSPR